MLTPTRTSCAHYDVRRLIQGNASGEVDVPQIFPGHLPANSLEIDSGSARGEDQLCIIGGKGGCGRWCSMSRWLLGPRELTIKKVVEQGKCRRGKNAGCRKWVQVNSLPAWVNKGVPYP